ncbi:hypothetical protein GW17_00007121 [Ensete ventricosum]|nr:hypothetical protein GW17_00007121 [Ensete ventricosum]
MAGDRWRMGDDGGGEKRKTLVGVNYMCMNGEGGHRGARCRCCQRKRASRTRRHGRRLTDRHVGVNVNKRGRNREPLLCAALRRSKHM